MNALAALYGQVALARRRWFRRAPSRRATAERPVISIGNLAAGGRGKTPVVAQMARLLIEMGERPAVLTRGYGRRDARCDLVIVHDGTRLLAGVDESGDEPVMLARALGTVPVVVAADRVFASAVAESHLGCTVHVLDDGFQHHRLARDLDCVIVTRDDVLAAQTFPTGRLREPVDALGDADVIFTDVGSVEDVSVCVVPLGVPAHQVLGLSRATGEPQPVPAVGTPGESPTRATPLVAVAGIAEPRRFASGLTAGGWRVVATREFGDHHWFTRADVEQIATLARAHPGALVVTTEKDLVRFERLAPLPFSLAVVPLTVDWPVAHVRDIVERALRRARQERAERRSTAWRLPHAGGIAS